MSRLQDGIEPARAAKGSIRILRVGQNTLATVHVDLHYVVAEASRSRPRTTRSSQQ